METKQCKTTQQNIGRRLEDAAALEKYLEDATPIVRNRNLPIPFHCMASSKESSSATASSRRLPTFCCVVSQRGCCTPTPVRERRTIPWYSHCRRVHACPRAGAHACLRARTRTRAGACQRTLAIYAKYIHSIDAMNPRFSQHSKAVLSTCLPLRRRQEMRPANRHTTEKNGMKVIRRSLHSTVGVENAVLTVR